MQIGPVRLGDSNFALLPVKKFFRPVCLRKANASPAPVCITFSHQCKNRSCRFRQNHINRRNIMDLYINA